MILVDEVKHITQDTPSCCGAACIAMVTGRSLDEVKKELGDPCGASEWRPYLKKMGVLCQLTEYVVGKYLYLVTIASMNLPGELHLVVMDTRNGPWKVYDPNEGREGKKVFTMDHFAQRNGQKWLYCNADRLIEPTSEQMRKLEGTDYFMNKVNELEGLPRVTFEWEGESSKYNGEWLRYDDVHKLFIERS